MQFELLTLDGAKYSGEASEVIVTTTEGTMTILPHHEALTAIVVPGPVTVRDKHVAESLFATFGGILDIQNNSVRLLADEAEHADDLVEHEIEEALARAKAAKEGVKDKHELHRAQQLIDRHAVRLEVARIRRRRRTHR
jgi:F-type H+-transporting ATPase subunit epsilon